MTKGPEPSKRLGLFHRGVPTMPTGRHSAYRSSSAINNSSKNNHIASSSSSSSSSSYAKYPSASRPDEHAYPPDPTLPLGPATSTKPPSSPMPPMTPEKGKRYEDEVNAPTPSPPVATNGLPTMPPLDSRASNRTDESSRKRPHSPRRSAYDPARSLGGPPSSSFTNGAPSSSSTYRQSMPSHNDHVDEDIPVPSSAERITAPSYSHTPTALHYRPAAITPSATTKKPSTTTSHSERIPSRARRSDSAVRISTGNVGDREALSRNGNPTPSSSTSLSTHRNNMPYGRRISANEARDTTSGNLEGVSMPLAHSQLRPPSFPPSHSASTTPAHIAASLSSASLTASHPAPIHPTLSQITPSYPVSSHPSLSQSAPNHLSTIPPPAIPDPAGSVPVISTPVVPTPAILPPMISPHPAPISEPLGVEHLMIKGKRYDVVNVLGRGGSANVFTVRSADRSLYALKRVVFIEKTEEEIKSFMQEVGLLKHLRNNRYIINLIDDEHREHRQDLLLLMELGSVNLKEVLLKWKAEGYDLNLVRAYWEQMLRAVQVVHAEGIIHSDLKPANFVLVGGQVKLIDFGIANFLSPETTNIQRATQIGSLLYMAPETLFEVPAGQNAELSVFKQGVAADVWALGCILYQMLYGSTPFMGKNHAAVFTLISHPNYHPPYPEVIRMGKDGPKGNVCRYAIAAIQRCLVKDKAMRGTIQEILELPFLHPESFCPGQDAISAAIQSLVAEYHAQGRTLDLGDGTVPPPADVARRITDKIEEVMYPPPNESIVLDR